MSLLGESFGFRFLIVSGVLLKMILLMFWRIWKTRIETGLVVIIARAHLSQLKIVHSLSVFTFGMFIAGIRHVDSWGEESIFSMSIAGIRHVDSWGVAPTLGVFEHWANNCFYVIWSFVMLLLSGMLVQYGLLGMSSISFLISRIFKFYVLNDQKTNQLIMFSLLFVSQSGCNGSWRFVLTVLCYF